MFDVIIVGYGPTGALLANFLGAQGISVCVFEREAQIYPLPRAIHFDGEVMRMFQAAGLATEVTSVARPATRGMHFVNADGEVLMERTLAPGIGPQGWANSWYFHQPELERVLREGANRFANVQTFCGHEVTAIEEHADVVGVRVRSPDGERVEYARLVVGCDGARSFVHSLIGGGDEDLGLQQQWLVVDVCVKEGSARGADLPQHTIQHCDPARPMTRCFIGGARRRWEIMLLPGDDPDALNTPSSIWSFLAPWLGPQDATLERSALYVFQSLIAHRWRRGRLLIAGDAAHQTPPFLGQGMCAGIRDAAALAWRLALVVRGRAEAAILDDYASERRPHVHAFIDLAVKCGDVIQATDSEAAAARDVDFAQSGPRLFNFPQPQLGPGMRPLLPRPAGSISEQPLLSDGTKLDDAIGYRFAVIASADTLAAINSRAARRLARWETSLVPATGAVAEWLEELGASAVVLRPDRYVHGVAADISALHELLDTLPIPA